MNRNSYLTIMSQDFPGGSEVKASAWNSGDLGWIPGEGNGNPLQYSCLENPMDRRAWQATVHGVAESDTTERLHFTYTVIFISFVQICKVDIFITLRDKEMETLKGLVT